MVIANFSTLFDVREEIQPRSSGEPIPLRAYRAVYERHFAGKFIDSIPPCRFELICIEAQAYSCWCPVLAITAGSPLPPQVEA